VAHLLALKLLAQIILLSLAGVLVAVLAEVVRVDF
jgi:hypothetical protein